MNYYEILGVLPESTLSEIRTAYHKLARKYHPDVNPSGAAKFKKISEAYETLNDTEKRKKYDILHGIFKKAQPKDEEKVEEEVKPTKTQNKKEEKKEKKSHKSVFDGFKSVFENNHTENIKPIDGKDISADVTINFQESLLGVERIINVVQTELCPRCKGRKFINGTRCNVCNGTGDYSQYKKINVKIPAKVRDGAKLRLKGEGNKGQFGGKDGDLYLLIHVKSSNNIEYDGLNVLCTVPVSPYEAVLGGDIVIPFFDGKVKLKLPAKTSSGQKFRLAGQGLTKNGKTGDMIITISIEISKDLSDDEVKLYEKLKQISSNEVRKNL